MPNPPVTRIRIIIVVFSLFVECAVRNWAAEVIFVSAGVRLQATRSSTLTPNRRARFNSSAARATQCGAGRVAPSISSSRGLRAGDVGTVVQRHESSTDAGPGYSLEFFDMTGRTVAVATVSASQLRAPTSSDLPSVRAVARSAD